MPLLNNRITFNRRRKNKNAASRIFHSILRAYDVQSSHKKSLTAEHSFLLSGFFSGYFFGSGTVIRGP
jgi:hypothetical protein